MNSLVTIRRLLAILMIAGLAMAPLSRPVMAEASAHGAMQADMTMVADQAAAVDAHGMNAAETPSDIPMAAVEMASEMPCCPSQAPVQTGCDKCVAMISCMSSGFVAMPIALLQPAFVLPGNALPRHADARADGMSASPPEHPPRTLV